MAKRVREAYQEDYNSRSHEHGRSGGFRNTLGALLLMAAGISVLAGCPPPYNPIPPTTTEQGGSTGSSGGGGSNPTNPPVDQSMVEISGGIQDMDSQAEEAGVIAVYTQDWKPASISDVTIGEAAGNDADGAPLIKTPANGKYDFKVEKGLMGIILQAAGGTYLSGTDNTDRSYISTLQIPTDKDGSYNFFTVPLAYGNRTVTVNGGVVQIVPKTFANFAFYTVMKDNGVTPGLFKWNFTASSLPDMLKRVVILYQGSDGTQFHNGQTDQIKIENQINDPSDLNYIGSLIGGIKLPVSIETYTGEFSNNDYIIYTDDKSGKQYIQPNPGYLVIEPLADINNLISVVNNVATDYLGGTKIWFDSSQNGYIQSALIGLKQDSNSPHPQVNAHELERALLLPLLPPQYTTSPYNYRYTDNSGDGNYDNWYLNDNRDQRVMLIDNPVSVGKPSDVEIDLGKIIKFYGPLTQAKNILGIKFGNNSLPYN